VNIPHQTGPEIDQGGSPRGDLLSQQGFDELFDRLKQWYTFTEHVERGALNWITPEVVKHAAGLVHHGIVIPTALPLNKIPGPDNNKPALHFMTEMTDREGEPGCNKDFIGLDFHGKAVSHLDALTHITYRGMIFGGRTSRDVVSTLGTTWAGVDTLGPIATRGVLLDIARFRKVKWLEPGEAVTKEEILEYEAWSGVSIGTGDCVLLRSGHFARRNSLGAWNPDSAAAGLDVSAMELFYERKISVLGGDGDSDVRPSRVANVDSPIHVLALTAMGIPLLDNLDLELLGQVCETNETKTFMAIIAPLNVPGGTGSPINVVGVL
jgi:kynurenine formamidase